MADNLQELKIPDGAFDTSDVKSLDDVPSMTAAELKAVFDYGAEMIVTPALNALIDFLASSKAAGALGITGLDGISGTTIQGLLQEIKKQIDDRYTKEESDLILESLVSAVKFDLETGVIRVEKRDGSFEEIDTEFDELAMQAEESAKQAVESAKQAEESVKQAIEIVGGDFATNANLQAHTEDEVRHITENERKAWNDKQDKLTFDNEPVSESLNPVISGGVKTAIDNAANGAAAKDLSNITGVYKSLLDKLEVANRYTWIKSYKELGEIKETALSTDLYLTRASGTSSSYAQTITVVNELAIESGIITYTTGDTIDITYNTSEDTIKSTIAGKYIIGCYDNKAAIYKISSSATIKKGRDSNSQYCQYISASEATLVAYSVKRAAYTETLTSTNRNAYADSVETSDYILAYSGFTLDNVLSGLSFNLIGRYEMDAAADSGNDTDKKIFEVDLQEALLSYKVIIVTVKKGTTVTAASGSPYFSIQKGGYMQGGGFPTFAQLYTAEGMGRATLKHDTSIMFTTTWQEYRSSESEEYRYYYRGTESQLVKNPAAIYVGSSRSFGATTIKGVMEVYAL